MEEEDGMGRWIRTAYARIYKGGWYWGVGGWNTQQGEGVAFFLLAVNEQMSPQ